MCQKHLWSTGAAAPLRSQRMSVDIWLGLLLFKYSYYVADSIWKVSFSLPGKQHDQWHASHWSCVLGPNCCLFKESPVPRASSPCPVSCWHQLLEARVQPESFRKKLPWRQRARLSASRNICIAAFLAHRSAVSEITGLISLICLLSSNNKAVEARVHCNLQDHQKCTESLQAREMFTCSLESVVCLSYHEYTTLQG